MADAVADKKVKKTTSAEKQARGALRRRLANQMVRNRLNTAEKSLRDLVKKGDSNKAREQLQVLFSLADRAAKNNVISFNAASRKKSRLSLLVSPRKK